MAINLTDELNAATKKGKLASAKQVYLEGDQENLQQIGEKTHQLENSIKDISASGGASTANAVSYSNETSGMTAVNAQAALDELAAKNKIQDATIAIKADATTVNTKNEEQDTEIAKKANDADVTSKMQTEQTRVNAELEKKFDKASLVQETGDAKDKAMSQKAVSDKLSDLDNDIDTIVWTKLNSERLVSSYLNFKGNIKFIQNNLFFRKVNYYSEDNTLLSSKNLTSTSFTPDFSVANGISKYTLEISFANNSEINPSDLSNILFSNKTLRREVVKHSQQLLALNGSYDKTTYSADSFSAGYVDSNGIVHEGSGTSWVKTDYIDIDGVSKIEGIFASDCNYIAGVAFFDSNKALVKAMKGTNRKEYNIPTEVTDIPSNAKYAIVTASNYGEYYHEVSFCKLKSDGLVQRMEKAEISIAENKEKNIEQEGKLYGIDEGLSSLTWENQTESTLVSSYLYKDVEAKLIQNNIFVRKILYYSATDALLKTENVTSTILKSSMNFVDGAKKFKVVLGFSNNSVIVPSDLTSPLFVSKALSAMVLNNQVYLEKLEGNLNGSYDKTTYSADSFSAGYVDSNGIVHEGSGTSWVKTDYIDIDGVSKIEGIFASDCNYIAGVAFFDSNKALVKAMKGTNRKEYNIPTEVTDIPSNAKYAIVTASNYGEYYHEVSFCKLKSDGLVQRMEERDKETENNLNQIREDIRGNLFSSVVTASSMSKGHSLKATCANLKSNFKVIFYGTIIDVTSLKLVFDMFTDRSQLTIDSTNVTYWQSNSSKNTFAHGLAFKDYISVLIDVTSIQEATLRISTNGGKFAMKVYWQGALWAYEARIEDETSIFTNCSLSFKTKEYSKPIWMFGDSYFGSWPLALYEDGYSNFMLIGNNGAPAKVAYDSFLTIIEKFTPSICLWALGMNNHESEEETTENNTFDSWVTYTTLFVEKCKEKNVKVIFMLAPNTPTISNQKKADYIAKNWSGYEVIDTNKAVGEKTSTAWYDGMLSVDNCHPATWGAYSIAKYVEANFPELE